MNPRRRAILAGGLYERLQQAGRIDKPELASTQNVFDSPAPKAANPGRWMARSPLPLPRSEMAWAAYDPERDAWQMRTPLPTARSGHGAVLYRGRIFVMGGEGSNRVFGQNEAYDPQKDAWEQYAPMPTPRHGLGAATVGNAIHVAGGGPVMGGGVQSAVHEAFTLA